MFEEYPKTIVLKDRSECILRPAREDDREAIADFFSRVSADDLWVLSKDLTDAASLDSFIRCMDPKENVHIVALEGAVIIGMAILHYTPFGARRHIGEITVLVDPAHKSRRLGSWMMIELGTVAAHLGLEVLKIELVVGKDDAAIIAAKRANFIPQATLKNFLEDRNGKWADLVILIKEIHESWSDY